MKDSEDPKGKRPSRKGGPTGDEPRRPSSASSRQPRRPKQAPHIPGTLSRDGTPKEMPPKKASAKSSPAARQSAPDAKQSASKKQGAAAGRSSTAKRAGTAKPAAKKTPGSKGPRTASPRKRTAGRLGGAVGTARRQAAPSRKLSAADIEQTREGAALRERRKKAIIVAIVTIAIIAAFITAAVIVRGQLAQREQQIISQSEDTSYEVVPCEPDMLDISLTRFGTIAGYPMTFGLTITNTSEQSCSLDAGSEHLAMRVTSGNDLIWNSAHCPAGAASRMYVFGPDVTSTINVEWSGARSNESCAGGLPAPRPGTYVVQGSVEGVDFAQMRDSFVLTDTAGVAPEPEPDPTEEPTESEEPDAEDDESPAPVTDESPPPEDYIPD